MRSVVLQKRNGILNVGYYIEYFIVALSYLMPYYFTTIDSLYTVRYGLLCFSLVLLTGVYFINIKTTSRLIIPIIMWYVLLIIGTINNSGDKQEAIFQAIKVILLCLNVGILIYDKDKKYSFLCAVRDVTIIFFVINLVCMIEYPSGIPNITGLSGNPYYLFGNINATIRCLVPGILCECLLFADKKTLSLNMFVFICGIIYMFLFVYRATTTILFIGFICIWILFKKFFIREFRRIYSWIVAGIGILEIMLVLLSSSGLINIIARITGKSTDLSGRVALWGMALFQIVQRPFIGLGIQSESAMYKLVGNRYSSHNYFLDVTLQQGIFGLLIIVLFTIAPLIYTKKHKEISNAAYIIAGFWLGYLIMFLAEPFLGVEHTFIPVLYSLALLFKIESRNKIEDCLD